MNLIKLLNNLHNKRDKVLFKKPSRISFLKLQLHKILLNVSQNNIIVLAPPLMPLHDRPKKAWHAITVASETVENKLRNRYIEQLQTL